jgi:cytidyltransferase-like protein
MENKDKRVYTKIVGDLFHVGHVRFLKAARELGRHLTVCVVPDERVVAYKNRKPVFSSSQRMEIVASCRWVDEVIDFGPKITTLDFMKENNFDIYAVGASNEAERESKIRDSADLPEEMRVWIPYSPEISSTMIRERLQKC